ncbi:bactofilin family protein [Vibrio rarus]|uniref:bactofilin family protein n=1 Tax=Vibrio rarus TaxID=413403 RepID=UPI0021C2CF99|nr:polymer-forming cytoskeletal protein [Vibrio rarus]
MHVDGTIIGQVSVEQALIVSQSGRVEGDIFAGKVIVNGVIEGSCHATSVEILESGQIQGTIYTDDLSIERGGKFNGDTQPAQKEQVVELTAKEAPMDSSLKQRVNN